jgi:hypothetical protein
VDRTESPCSGRQLPCHTDPLHYTRPPCRRTPRHIAGPTGLRYRSRRSPCRNPLRLSPDSWDFSDNRGCLYNSKAPRISDRHGSLRYNQSAPSPGQPRFCERSPFVRVPHRGSGRHTRIAGRAELLRQSRQSPCHNFPWNCTPCRARCVRRRSSDPTQSRCSGREELFYSRSSYGRRNLARNRLRLARGLTGSQRCNLRWLCRSLRGLS